MRKAKIQTKIRLSFNRSLQQIRIHVLSINFIENISILNRTLSILIIALQNIWSTLYTFIIFTILNFEILRENI